MMCVTKASDKSQCGIPMQNPAPITAYKISLIQNLFRREYRNAQASFLIKVLNKYKPVYDRFNSFRLTACKVRKTAVYEKADFHSFYRASYFLLIDYLRYMGFEPESIQFTSRQRLDRKIKSAREN